jgi:hypothetical protein
MTIGVALTDGLADAGATEVILTQANLRGAAAHLAIAGRTRPRPGAALRITRICIRVDRRVNLRVSRTSSDNCSSGLRVTVCRLFSCPTFVRLVNAQPKSAVINASRMSGDAACGPSRGGTSGVSPGVGGKPMSAPSGTQARKGVVMMPSVSSPDLGTLSSKTAARADALASPCPGDGGQLPSVTH